VRLTELRPRWVSFGYALPEHPNARWYVALTFECPHCRTQRLAVFFEPEIDDGGLGDKFRNWDTYKEMKSSHLMWARQGETFETLTLVPSVNAEVVGHWHGSITNGEVT
jgi:hypothetical protein